MSVLIVAYQLRSARCLFVMRRHRFFPALAAEAAAGYICLLPHKSGNMQASTKLQLSDVVCMCVCMCVYPGQTHVFHLWRNVSAAAFAASALSLSLPLPSSGFCLLRCHLPPFFFKSSVKYKMIPAINFAAIWPNLYPYIYLSIR